MQAPSIHDTESIAPRPVIWVWLLLNILWLQLVVPVWIVSNDLVVLDPEATLLRKVIAAGTMIVVIPFAGVIGVALATLSLLLWIERLLRGLRG
jgi:hypothetical protein